MTSASVRDRFTGDAAAETHDVKLLRHYSYLREPQSHQTYRAGSIGRWYWPMASGRDNGQYHRPIALRGRDAHGFVLTGQAVASHADNRLPASLESSVPGIFAVGDVRSGSVKRVGGASGEGAAAVALIHQHLAALY
jgi:hypothetical protein